MQIDAHNMDREQRRALLEQRRSAVAHQLRRLAIELTDIDRQLDEIEQSEAEARHPRPRATRLTNDRTGHGMSVSERVCTGCQPQLRQKQRSIDQLCRENAAHKERIQQMEWER